MKEIITRKDFLAGKWKIAPGKGTSGEHPIVSLLRIRCGKAFTVKAIATITKRNKSTVHGMLRKLVKKGLVQHDKPYFMWKSFVSSKKSSKKKKR